MLITGDPFDTRVELRGLLSADEQQLLLDAQRDLDCGLWIYGEEEEPVLGPPGSAPPPAVAASQPEAEPLRVETSTGAYLCGALFHEGRRLALVAAGTVDGERERTARYLCRLAELLLLSALRHTLAARVHVASVEESYIELMHKNQRLEQTLQRMQELDRIKANFLATVSHELRTPLTSVIGYSEMLMEELAGPLNDNQREYLRTVMDKGEQLLQLITGILDISRMEASGIQLHRGAVDLQQLVSEVVNTVLPQARRKRIALVSECPRLSLPPSAPILVDGDRDKLRQVLLNLVGNAIKFTPESGRVTIRLGPLDEAHGMLQLSVADTGIGIPKELRDKVFDPFYQVDNSYTREYEGTGLGLSIVRKFVEAHGGRVWIAERPPRQGEGEGEGLGTTFCLTLPLVRPATGE